jgi:plastocyanin
LSCTPTEPASEPTVDLHEFSIDTQHTWVEGEHTVAIMNTGEEPHTFVVETSDGDVISATLPIQPGNKRTVTLDLPPGTYRFTCRLVETEDTGELEDHFAEGMVTMISVT